MVNNAIKVTCTIQARMGSSRLPGKVMEFIEGIPMLELLCTRMLDSNLFSDIFIVTSTSETDNIIERHFEGSEIFVFRGSENDVLNRVATLGNIKKVFWNMELFGDSPFICKNILSRALEIADPMNPAIITNARKNEFPHGMEFLLYPFKFLVEYEKMISKSDMIREHVGSNLLSSGNYNIIDLQAQTSEKFENLYLEVDEKVDLVFLRTIAAYLKNDQKFPYFSLADILEVVRSKKIELNNSGVFRRWKEVQKKY